MHPELWLDHQKRKPPAKFVIHNEGKKQLWPLLSTVKLPSSFGMTATKLFHAFDPGLKQKIHFLFILSLQPKSV